MLTHGFWVPLAVLVFQSAALAQSQDRLREVLELPRSTIDASLHFDATNGFYLGWLLKPPSVEIAEIQKTMTGNVSDASRHYRLGQLYEKLDLNDRSKQHYSKAAQFFFQQINAQPADGWLRAQYAKAWEELDNKDHGETEAVYRQAVQLAPKDWRCWAALGTHLHRQGLRVATENRGGIVLAGGEDQHARAEKCFTESEQCFNRAVALAPQEPVLYSMRAFARASIGAGRALLKKSSSLNDVFHSGCLDDLKQVARLKPADCQAIMLSAMAEYMAYYLELEGKEDGPPLWPRLPPPVQESLRQDRLDLERMAQAQDKKLAAEALEAAGILVSYIWKDDDKAEEYLHQAANRDPSRDVAWHMLLQIQGKQHRADAMVATCKDRLQYHESVTFHLSLAFVYERTDRLGQANQQIEAALRLGPKDFEANLAKAIMVMKYGALNQLTEAWVYLETAQKCLGEAPSNELTANLAVVRGIFFALSGKKFEARLQFKEALKADSKNKQALQAMHISESEE